MRQDRINITFVTIDDKEEVLYTISIVPKSMTLDDLICHYSIFDVGATIILTYTNLLYFVMTSFLFIHYFRKQGVYKKLMCCSIFYGCLVTIMS